MSLKLNVVKGVEDNGAFVAPDTEKLTKDDVVFFGTDEKNVSIDGIEAGNTVETGEYFVGKFNETEDKFVSKLIAVPQFTVTGEATLDNLNVTATEDGATVEGE